ncbi:MAG: hypothetical protein JJE46_16410 [Acidimicrobiia bacterium]|nr:hypothetical protein [Acidimicrobiia bacterium]
MNTKNKLIGAGAVLLAFGGLGTAVASASTADTTKPPTVQSSVSTKNATTEPTSATDTDNVQQGDQTSPDAPGAVETPDPNQKADTPEAGDKADSSTESPTETESASDADGPGGHQDPPGQVDNQQEGQH